METRFPQMEAVTLPPEMKAPMKAIANASKRLGQCPSIGKDKSIAATALAAAICTAWDEVGRGINDQNPQGVYVHIPANALGTFIAMVLGNIDDEAAYEAMAQSLITATLDRDNQKMMRVMLDPVQGATQ